MRRNKKSSILYLLLLLIVGLSVGYSLLSANLRINGTSKINSSSWNVHFANLEVSDGSVELSSEDVGAAIDSTETKVEYTVTLNKPGDFYEFKVDAVNEGTINAMVENYTITMNDAPITDFPSYLEYIISYEDGIRILPNQRLDAGHSETILVRVEFKRDIEVAQLPAENQSITFKFGVNYIQADSTAMDVRLTGHSFTEDSWNTIAAVLIAGDSSVYTVGSTKTVDMGSLGTHIVRIVNKSTPAECAASGFSETACGFVIEFADIITTHRMNPAYNGGAVGTGNLGGWKSSELRDYVANDIYNALPEDLRTAIIDTQVVSGHGSTTGETNFTTTDKLYPLSTKEVGLNIEQDTVQSETRVLDYYNANNSDATRIKKLNQVNTVYWMRSSRSTSDNYFNIINTEGGNTVSNSYDAGGVSLAFRLRYNPGA